MSGDASMVTPLAPWPSRAHEVGGRRPYHLVMAAVRRDVRNQGEAISESTLGHMFDPLRRGSQQSEEPAEGSLGLGLFIARGIAQAHGGSIDARSDADGTVFTVRLPR